MPESIAYLVESIPVGMDELREKSDSVYTESVLKRLTDSAQTRIDLVAMYWNLLPDVTSVDEEGFSSEQFGEFGAEHGRLLYEALVGAARRGVHIRILQSPGFKEGPQESDEIAQRFPHQVRVRRVDMAEWYGGGIMHQKMWIFDGHHVYIGSANMDWRALTQVKELGVVVEYEPEIAADAEKQFEAYWQFAGLPPSSVEILDPEVQVRRQVPNWSALVPETSRASSPMARPELMTNYNIACPMPLAFNGRSGDAFITSSPPELCAPGRSSDLDGILHTIQTAEKSIGVSVMSFTPLGFQLCPSGTTDLHTEDGEAAPIVLWWPALVDALLDAVITRQVHVRLLVSHWAYSSAVAAPYLRALKATADAIGSDPEIPCGKLEIKQFIIPGWDEVLGDGRRYPGHTRVNHPKYIVTDQRLNIGTSNMTWNYFAHSAGCSFNSDHPELLQQLQAIFDRDWESSYAHPLE